VSEEHYAKLRNMYASAPCNRVDAPDLSVYKGKALLTLAVRPNMFHSAGALHDSYYFRAMEDAARFAVSSLISDFLVSAISFNCYILRQVTSGVITAEGVVKSTANDAYVAETVLSDSAGEPVGRGSGVFRLSRIKLVPEVGYTL